MLLLSYAAVLLLAVLLSHLAHRTVLSTAVLFLVAGFLLGDGVLGVIDLTGGDDLVGNLAELALFAVLFTDGMRVGLKDLTSAWRLPGRALLLGLPLTLAVTAVFAHYVAGLDWADAFLLGAVLAPTDPVFAAALVGNDKVPGRLRHLLNVESGVNDGLALPFVVVLLAVASGEEDFHLGLLMSELALGLAIGVVVPYAAIRPERTRLFRASSHYEPLNAVAIGLLVLALSEATHANLFIAAFAAGVTIATAGAPAGDLRGVRRADRRAAEARGAAGVRRVDHTGVRRRGQPRGWVFVVLAIFVAWPVALWVSFLGSELTRREQLAAMWFGPKGFASVVYGLYVLNAGIGSADELFHLIAITVCLSILLHSSTDVVVARGFDEEREAPHWHGEHPTVGDDLALEAESGPEWTLLGPEWIRHRQPWSAILVQSW
ncbi:cation:proton antiporter [Nocardioides sp.]|uniref:cation:proton antiporter domain-containing protein n=1 Tax=Nocardioides sp. TaxID=35761 RepID=UPI0035273B96